MAAPPAHKTVPGTGFSVDAFTNPHPSVRAYFLSHAHSDHYNGLSEAWNAGPIYCSEVTATLVSHICGVRPDFIRPLPMNEPVAVLGVEVTLVDANHCPGAVQLLFKLSDGKRYLHSGDMRYCPAMQACPHLQAFKGCTALYLDTTYAQPKFASMPPQEDAVHFVAEKIAALEAEAGRGAALEQSQGEGNEEGNDEGNEEGNEEDGRLSGASAGPRPDGREAGSAMGRFKRIYLICTYTIGKERILYEVRRRCGLKICVTDWKWGMLRCLGLPEEQLHDTFTTDPGETPVHVVKMDFLGETWPYFRPNFANMERYQAQHGAQEVVGFCPTGWMMSEKGGQPQGPPCRVKGATSVYLVAYSEHSSFSELQDYVRFLRPAKLVPTVGVSGDDNGKALHSILRHFSSLLDQGASKRQFLSLFSASSASLPPTTTAANGGDGEGSGDAPAATDGGPPAAGAEEDSQAVGAVAVESDVPETAAASEAEQLPLRPARQGGEAAEAVASAATSASIQSVAAASATASAEEEQLLAVLEGSSLSAEDARKLLRQAKGNVAAAVNLFYDGAHVAGGTTAAAGNGGGGGTAGHGVKSKANGSSKGAEGGSRSSPASASKQQGGGGGKKRSAAAAEGGQRKKPSSGSAAGNGKAGGKPEGGGAKSQGGGAKSPGGGKPNQLLKGQQSIKSFFFGSSSPPAAQGSQQGSQQQPASQPSQQQSQQQSQGDAELPEDVTRLLSEPTACPERQAVAAVLCIEDSSSEGEGKEEEEGSEGKRGRRMGADGSGGVGTAAAGPAPATRTSAAGLTCNDWGRLGDAAERAGGDDAEEAPVCSPPAPRSLGMPRFKGASPTSAGGAAADASASPHASVAPAPAAAAAAAAAVPLLAAAPRSLGLPRFKGVSPTLASGAGAASYGGTVAGSLPAAPMCLASLLAQSSQCQASGMGAEALGMEAKASAEGAGEGGRVSNGGGMSGDEETPSCSQAGASPSSKEQSKPKAAAAAQPQQQHRPGTKGSAPAGAKGGRKGSGSGGAGGRASKGGARAAEGSKPPVRSHFFSPRGKAPEAAAAAAAAADAGAAPPSPTERGTGAAAPPVAAQLQGLLLPAGAAATVQSEGPPAGPAAAATAATPSASTACTGAAAAPAAAPLASTSKAAAAAAAQQQQRWREHLLLPVGEFDPVCHACWSAGQPAPYLHLALALQAIDATTKRLIIQGVLTNMFRALIALGSPAEVVAATYLCTGRTAAEHEVGGELGVGGATVSAALMEATGVSKARLRELYRELGDIGDVAEATRTKQTTLRRPQPLTVLGVLRALRGLSGGQGNKGQGAQGRRKEAVRALLMACVGPEIKYLVRILVGNLRVGASWRSIVGPLAMAATLHRHAVLRAEQQHRASSVAGGPGDSGSGAKVPDKAALAAAAAAASEAYHVCPSFDVLVPALLESGAEGLARRCVLTPGVPVKPMLARICTGVADSLRMLGAPACGPFLAEYKYDGVRAQIHLLPNGQLKIFSRNSEDRTNSFPDVCRLIKDAASAPAPAPGQAQAPAPAATRTSPAATAAEPEEAAAGSAATPGTGSPRPAAPPPDAMEADGLGSSNGGGGCSGCSGGTTSGSSSVVLDAEVVAVERDEEGHVQRLRAFQELSTRARGQVQEEEVQVPVCIYIFDILYRDGAALLHLPLAERRALVPIALPGLKEGFVQMATSVVIDPVQATTLGGPATAGPGPAPADAEAAEVTKAVAAAAESGQADALLLVEEQVMELLLQSFNDGAEGLMLKSLTATYQASRRSEAWIKIKKDYCEGLRDSLDLVPIGAWWGQGRKVRWLSPFLMAAWDPEREEFQSVCRCMSGFSDAFYAEATERLMARAIPGPKKYYNTLETPSVWFEPSEVWEIRGADLSLSPVHRAALGRLHPDRGVGLRFPRFIRIRDDKSTEDATGPDVLVDLFNKQTRKWTTGGGGQQQGKRRAPPSGGGQEGREGASGAVAGEGEEAADEEEEHGGSSEEGEGEGRRGGGKEEDGGGVEEEEEKPTVQPRRRKRDRG